MAKQQDKKPSSASKQLSAGSGSRQSTEVEADKAKAGKDAASHSKAGAKDAGKGAGGGAKQGRKH